MVFVLLVIEFGQSVLNSKYKVKQRVSPLDCITDNTISTTAIVKQVSSLEHLKPSGPKVFMNELNFRKFCVGRKVDTRSLNPNFSFSWFLGGLQFITIMEDRHAGSLF